MEMGPNRIVERRCVMHLFKVNSFRRYIRPTLSLLLFVAVVAGIWFGLTSVQTRSGAQQTKLLKDALRRAAVSCYAVEGRYPPTLEYIKENYGVVVNDERFIVRYIAFAENIMPTIRVLELGKEAVDDDATDDI